MTPDPPPLSPGPVVGGRQSLSTRTLRLAAIRIGIVSLLAGLGSYLINRSLIEEAVRAQLLLSTEQTIQREALPFREIRDLEQNFLAEFRAIDGDPALRPGLVRDFDRVFVRHADGSYTQRPGLFEGEPLPDGRRFPNMSATYSPEVPLTDDIKARFTLSFLLSYKYGSATRGRTFNFYGVVPEKGFPIHQAADITRVYGYGGDTPLQLETYEFFSRGFDPAARDTFITRMYFDASNNSWMTTVATPDGPGRHRILACVDVLLDDLLERLARPAIAGAHSMLFLSDEAGTLMFHPDHMDEIRHSDGQVSIRSLGLKDESRILEAGRPLPVGKVVLIDTHDSIVAVGRIPETGAILGIEYPRLLMRPAIVQNLAVVIAVGLFTLLVELVIIRSILRDQIAGPLAKLILATRMLGAPAGAARPARSDLPTGSQDEIGELARDFAAMADRVLDAQAELERKVRERTGALEEANRRLEALSTTDGLTGVANRRHFDEVLASHLRRVRRTGGPLTLAMIDVDWFKKYNDCYGHVAGDDCLRTVAQVLTGTVQRAGDFVARYGGEEFVLIMEGCGSDDGLPLAQAIRAAVERQALPHERSPFGVVTISVGIASADADGSTTPDRLLKRADDALYRAKGRGRNQVVSAEDESADPARR